MRLATTRSRQRQLRSQQPLDAAATYASTNALRVGHQLRSGGIEQCGFDDQSADGDGQTVFDRRDHRLRQQTDPRARPAGQFERRTSARIRSYVRPFFDEVNASGHLDLFNNANYRLYVERLTYVGRPGLSGAVAVLGRVDHDGRVHQFQPTADHGVDHHRRNFPFTYVIAGSTLEDFYTEGLEGDVIARNGNTLTLRGATLFANAAQDRAIRDPGFAGDLWPPPPW